MEPREHPFNSTAVPCLHCSTTDNDLHPTKPRMRKIHKNEFYKFGKIGYNHISL